MKLNQIEREELKKMLRETDKPKQEPKKSLDERIAEYKANAAFTSKGCIDLYLKRFKYVSDGMARKPVSLSNGKFVVNL